MIILEFRVAQFIFAVNSNGLPLYATNCTNFINVYHEQRYGEYSARRVLKISFKFIVLANSELRIANSDR